MLTIETANAPVIHHLDPEPRLAVGIGSEQLTRLRNNSCPTILTRGIRTPPPSPRSEPRSALGTGVKRTDVARHKVHPTQNIRIRRSYKVHTLSVA